MAAMFLAIAILTVATVVAVWAVAVLIDAPAGVGARTSEFSTRETPPLW
jgi:hypothetical protein